jgi:polysaccharide biosynthesis protein PslG
MVVAGLVLALAVASGPQNSAVAKLVVRPGVGVQFHCTWSSFSRPARARIATLLAAAGVATVRIDVGWASLQPKPARRLDPWSLALVDYCVDLARARGMNVLMTLMWTPPWASGSRDLGAPPQRVSDFAWLARRLARHFRGRVDAYEVWSEPDQTRFWKGSAADYARLLRAAFPAIKNGDPRAKVVFAGTTHNNTTWISAAYAAGAKGSFDVMATHPYQGVGDAAPETRGRPEEWWLLTHVSAVHALMADYGDGAKPIWFSEFGWSMHGNAPGTPHYRRGVTPELQASYLVRALRLIRKRFPYVGRAYWYKEAATRRDDEHEAGYGLLGADLKPRPAYLALKRFLRR